MDNYIRGTELEIGTHIAAKIPLHDLTFLYIIGWIESYCVDGAYIVRITSDDSWGQPIKVYPGEVTALGLTEIYK